MPGPSCTVTACGVGRHGLPRVVDVCGGECWGARSCRPAAWREEGRQGGVSRSGALRAGALCQGQGVARSEPEAPGADAMAAPPLGAAVPDGAVARGARRSATRSSPPPRVGSRPARRVAGAPLTPNQRAGRRGGPPEAARAWLEAVRPAVCVILRVRLDAAFDEPAPPRQPRPPGRPRPQGQRRPPRAPVLTDATPPGTAVTVARWDGGSAPRVPRPADPAGWDHAGQPVGPLRWGVSRAPAGPGAPHAWLRPSA